jgi:hypothetical protein
LPGQLVKFFFLSIIVPIFNAMTEESKSVETDREARALTGTLAELNPFEVPS